MKINIGIEFKYAEILAKLDLFEKYMDGLEENLKSLANQEALRTSLAIQKITNIAKRQIMEHDFKGFVNHIIPLFFRNPALVSLWAIYESSVIEIADHLNDQKRNSKKMKNYRKKERELSFLDRSFDYFQNILKVDLCSNSVFKKLDKVIVLRNVIAHCNGNLENVRENNRNTIIEWVKEDIDIDIYQGDLLISERFLKENYLIVKNSLCDLINRVSSKQRTFLH